MPFAQCDRGEQVLGRPDLPMVNSNAYRFVFSDAPTLR
jgi:hypothetical protein